MLNFSLFSANILNKKSNSSHNFILPLLLFLLFSNKAFALADSQQNQLRQLVQLAEYVGVDYEAAVEHGEIINLDEYNEMVEFSALISDKITNINSSEQTQLIQQAAALKQSITAKASLIKVRQLSADLRQTLLQLVPGVLLPAQILSHKSTQALYMQHCASCHGDSGQGDGQLAAQLSPRPIDFTDKSRAENRSLLGLYGAITNGLDDTAMPAFSQLKEQQRWSLALYTGSLAFTRGSEKVALPKGVSVQQWINSSPAQLTANNSLLTAELASQLRAMPTFLFSGQKNPISITKKQLNLALVAYSDGEYKKAKDYSVSAYLDGFELIENSLDAHDKPFRKAIEINLINLRQLISKAGQQEQLTLLSTTIFEQLNQADHLLTNSSLSNGALFTASLVILLREGLEALLVVIALMTVLIKTGRKDTLKYVHFGWFSALVAGFGTWLVAQSLITISGASREVMEGVAAMVAAIMLLYVGIWMHSKTKADQWQAYINKHINAQLRSGTLWGLSALAFIAVYREVFETVLFYQSLLTQASPAQYSYTAAGFITATLILATFAWLMLKYSVKLPIARFFSATTYLLLALSFILMGKAVSALQEAAIINISPLPVHIEFDWIGVGSTWQGIMAQGVIIVFFAFYLQLTKVKSKQANLAE